MKRSITPFYQVVSISVSIILLVSLQSHILAESEPIRKVRIAVVEFRKTGDPLPFPDLDTMINEWLTTFLVNIPFFEVVERQALQRVLEEQSLGQSGVIDPKSAAKVGKLLGVNILVTGTIIYFEDEFEITTRFINTTNGAIVGAASVTAYDKDELRETIQRLAEIIQEKLSPTSGENGVKVLETFDGDALPTRHWGLEFGEDVVEADLENTDASLQDGFLRITGTYDNDDDKRYLQMFPLVEQSYQSCEVKARIRDVDGAASICLHMEWNHGEHWTDLCLYVGDDYSDLSIDVDDNEKVTVTLSIPFNQWHTLRVDYRDAAFQYYWNDQLMKHITPEPPVRLPEQLTVGLALAFEETRSVTLDIDEISLR